VQIAQRSDLPASAPANINGYIASQTNGLYYLNGESMTSRSTPRR
jgi:hypothetical protein